MKTDLERGARWLVGTALFSCLACPALVFGQTEGASEPAPQEAASDGLADIVVTAQRREQRLQDVPIAITALTADTLQSNRVTNVTDLSGLAPNLVARQSAGSTGIPSFSMRGITSYGVVPGSDKEISIYIDGVYIGSPRGSIFDLPDIARVEVLRGPQGTLFGRNATAGAVSITTRDPKGEFAVRQEISVGNYDQFRSRTSVDLPAWGPFSAYATYMHNYKRGDIRNLGAGQRWDRTGPQTDEGVQISPKYLGTKKADSWFLAVKFEPSDSFDTVYKFDHSTDHFTPEGVAAIAVNPAVLGPTGAFLNAVLAASPEVLTPGARRPKAVNNSYSTPGYSKVWGHSLTSNLRISDSLSAKNIAAYRRSYIYSNAQIDGIGGLVNPLAGNAPFALVGSQNQSLDKQFSDELQFNYDSDLVTLTVGGLYFWQKGRGGGPRGMINTQSFGTYPGGRIPLGNVSISYNRATSIAAYAQAEVHVTPELDLVAGGRVTRDRKSGTYLTGGTFVPGPNGFEDGTVTGIAEAPFSYRKTKPNYSLGVNYKVDPDILLFAKYSTAFVSGGSVGGVDFDPETAKSWEAGIKADFLDRRLRTNLALYTVKYGSIQSAQSGQNVNRPTLGTVIIPLGDGRAKGFELELTALPVTGLTLTGSLGYTDVKYSDVNPILTRLANGDYLPTLTPKWTYNLSAQYQTEPLFGDTTLMLRADANGRTRMRAQHPGQFALSPAFGVLEYIPPAWIVNGRIALQDVAIGPVEAEIALWGRNLTNNRAPTFPLNIGNFILSSSFQAARTYGADVIVKF